MSKRLHNGNRTINGCARPSFEQTNAGEIRQYAGAEKQGSSCSGQTPHAPSASGRDADHSRLLLILNSAEDRLQLCLARDGLLLAHQDWVVPGQAMRHLAPALDRLLNAFDLRVADLQGIACVRGPGGFTGLRQCLATAFGLAMGASLPMAGLDYLPLLAAGPAALLQGRLAVLTHARHGLVHAQVFSVPDLAGLSDPQVMPVDAPGLLQDHAARSVLFLLGSGVRRNAASLAASMPRAVVLDPLWDHPGPETLIRAAWTAEFLHRPIEPLYLRASDAEDNLESIASKRGLDPREARRRLADSLKDIPS